MATKRVSGHCAVHYHPNDGISLGESFRYHPYWLWLGTDLPSLLACSCQTENCLLLPSSLHSLPASYPHPSHVGPSVEWSHWVADGKMGIDKVSLCQKLIGRDRERVVVPLNGTDMMRKSMQNLPVHLHTVSGVRLMFSLQGVIRSFDSTLTS